MKQAIILGLVLVTLNCMSLCSSHQALGNKFTITFSYMCRDNTPFDSCGFSLLWNGATVADIIAEDYEIHHKSINVQGRVGENVINFSGTGRSDALGMTIDNVKLLRECGCGFENYIVNGGFDQALYVDQGWRYYNGIEGWKAEEIQVGNGKYYNHRWNPNNPVCELDASKNSDIYQNIYLDDQWRVVDYRRRTPSVLA